MATSLRRAVISGLLILEALKSALWISALLPSLPVRDRTTIVLVSLRAVLSGFQVAAAITVRVGGPSGPAMARMALAASALLIPFETGLRLVPTDLDPTYRWWLVVAYWVYAAAVAMVVGK